MAYGTSVGVNVVSVSVHPAAFLALLTFESAKQEKNIVIWMNATFIQGLAGKGEGEGGIGRHII